jgi:hypothetical protein
MKGIIYRAVVAFLLLNCFLMGCQGIKSGEIRDKTVATIKGEEEIKIDTLRKVSAQSTDIKTLLKELTEQEVEILYHWKFSFRRNSTGLKDEPADYLCVVTRHFGQEHGFPTDYVRLNFYEKKGDKLLNTYAYDTDFFKSLTPIVENRILATFHRGNSLHFVIFAFVDGEIRIVLDEISQGGLEMVDIDNDGEVEILIRDQGPVKSALTNKIIIYPQEALAFKWDGKTYEQMRSVPWKNRFRELLKNIRDDGGPP